MITLRIEGPKRVPRVVVSAAELDGRSIADKNTGTYAARTFVGMGAAVLAALQIGQQYWRCQDGRVMRPDEMSNTHMLNCLRMVGNSKKAHRLMLAVALATPNTLSDNGGNMDQAHSEWLEWMSKGADFKTRIEALIQYSPVLATMVRYLQQRGFDPFVDHGPMQRTRYEAPQPMRAIEDSLGPENWDSYGGNS